MKLLLVFGIAFCSVSFGHVKVICGQGADPKSNFKMARERAIADLNAQLAAADARLSGASSLHESITPYTNSSYEVHVSVCIAVEVQPK